MSKHRRHRKRPKRTSLMSALGWLALVLMGAMLIGLAITPAGRRRVSAIGLLWTGNSAARSAGLAISLSLPGAQAARKFYPYSVIPGGVRSIAELKKNIAEDAVVALQYAGFDLQDARVVRLQHARLAYVSYRIGNRVYWTKHKVLLPRGETVITDGVHMARTRCGNLVSAVRQKPVSSQEPSSAAMNRPEPPPALLTYESSSFPPAELVPPLHEASVPPSPSLLPQGPPPAGGGGGDFLPPVGFFPGGWRLCPCRSPASQCACARTGYLNLAVDRLASRLVLPAPAPHVTAGRVGWGAVHASKVWAASLTGLGWAV